MKRIEFKDLKPGDHFEYERRSRYSRPQVQMRRDRVKPLSDGTWRVSETHDKIVDGQAISVPGNMVLYTEIGQTNHHYVTLAPDTVVLLLEDGDHETPTPAATHP